MPFALELALDLESAAVVRAAWRALAAAGFPLMADLGANPHVSLAIWEQIDVTGMSAAVAEFGRETAELPIAFDRIAVFPTTGVVFLAPVPDAALHDMQARCQRRLGAHGRQPWSHYAPDVWVPHCTLAQDLADAGALARARAVAERTPLPVVGRLQRAELVRFRPVHCLSVAPLTAPASAS
jgi:2'-5' RNA ligase